MGWRESARNPDKQGFRTDILRPPLSIVIGPRGTPISRGLELTTSNPVCVMRMSARNPDKQGFRTI